MTTAGGDTQPLDAWTHYGCLRAVLVCLLGSAIALLYSALCTRKCRQRLAARKAKKAAGAHKEATAPSAATAQPAAPPAAVGAVQREKAGAGDGEPTVTQTSVTAGPARTSAAVKTPETQQGRKADAPRPPAAIVAGEKKGSKEDKDKKKAGSKDRPRSELKTVVVTAGGVKGPPTGLGPRGDPKTAKAKTDKFDPASQVEIDSEQDQILTGVLPPAYKFWRQKQAAARTGTTASTTTHEEGRSMADDRTAKDGGSDDPPASDATTAMVPAPSSGAKTTTATATRTGTRTAAHSTAADDEHPPHDTSKKARHQHDRDKEKPKAEQRHAHCTTPVVKAAKAQPPQHTAAGTQQHPDDLRYENVNKAAPANIQLVNPRRKRKMSLRKFTAAGAK